jgi:hypothetical protein
MDRARLCLMFSCAPSPKFLDRINHFSFGYSLQNEIAISTSAKRISEEQVPLPVDHALMCRLIHLRLSISISVSAMKLHVHNFSRRWLVSIERIHAPATVLPL